MKILSIGNFGYGWDGSICDEEHIANALEELGHEVIKAQRDGDLFSFSGKKGYDFVLIAQWDGYKDLPNFHAPIVYWAFDYQADGQKWHEDLVKQADLYLSKPLSDSKYKNWQWLSQDFAPDFLDKYQEPIEKDIDVLFTGSWVPWESGKERVKVLKAIDEKFNLHIYGVTADKWKEEGFKNVYGPAMDNELPKLIARAKINFSMDHVLAPGYWSDRNAQIMSCGGFVLFRHVPLSEAIFGSNVSYFSKVEECLNNIEFWLANDRTREAVAEAGYHHAKANLQAINRAFQLTTLVWDML